MSKFHADVVSLNLTGKVALVFGGTSGIGEGTALALARQGASVVITGFTASKGEKVVEKLKSLSPPSSNATFSYSVFDAADFNAIKKFVTDFKSTHSELHYLVLSVGGPTPLNLEPTVANGKVSRTLAVNFVARYLILSQLLPLLESTSKSSPPGSVRVMTVMNPKLAPPSLEKYKDDFGLIKIPHGSLRYWMSINIAVLYQNIVLEEFAKQAPEIAFMHIHPGAVDTPLFEKAPKVISWVMKTGIKILGIKMDSVDTAGERIAYYLALFETSKSKVSYIGINDEIVVPKRSGDVEQENQTFMKWLHEVCE